MAMIEQSVEIDAPAAQAYAVWTQFEQFPQFMQGVESVRQQDDRRLHWRANVWGDTEEWDAEITEQIPDKRIAWQATTGTTNAGVVTFHRLSDDRSRVMLQLEYEPDTLAKKAGDWLGLLERRVEGDMKRFRKVVEERGRHVAGWPGAVPSKDEVPR